VRKALRTVLAGPIALGLLAAGAIVVGGRPQLGAAPVPAGAVLLGPAGGGDLGSTIRGLQARIREGGGDARAYASLGLAYLQMGRYTADASYYPKAEAVLDRSLALDRASNFDALIGMGALSLARHDFVGALEWGRRAREANPAGAQARGVIGDALLELGRYGAARRAYQAMIDLRPNMASYARVSAFRELVGDVRGADRALTVAFDLAAGPPDASWAGFRLGELRLGVGRVREAARSYRTAGELAPDAVLPLVGLARIAAVHGNLERATGILSEVVRRYPAPEFVILLGDLYRAAGRRDLGRDQYALVRAIAGLYRAGGVNTDLEMALFDADHRIRPKRALAHARAQYRLRPSVQAADVLAWTLYVNGRYGAAERYSDEALRLHTPNALFRFHAGMTALRLGRRAEARGQLSAALALNPSFSWLWAEKARRVLDRLGSR